MKPIVYRLVLFTLAGVLLSACGTKPKVTEHVAPSIVDAIEGTDLSRVILTEKAAERLGIETITASGDRVPYAAVIYDTEGNTWVYTSPEPLTFVRALVKIEYIEGDTAVLAESLDTGLTVVTVGVSELYGTETGVSK
jgi:hypothetical protein